MSVSTPPLLAMAGSLLLVTTKSRRSVISGVSSGIVRVTSTVWVCPVSNVNEESLTDVGNMCSDDALAVKVSADPSFLTSNE